MRLPIWATVLPTPHDGMTSPRALEPLPKPFQHPLYNAAADGPKIFLDRTAKSLTTLCMHKPTSHANLTKTAIAYVRVSTREQVTEGVSLDAQRDRLRSYCKLNGIKLIDIIADEGISGSTLERPGLQAALPLIKRGRVNERRPMGAPARRFFQGNA